jgi:hypothetical protein
MVAATAPAKATPERIQARAYEIFRSRNGGPGDAVSDWLRAEAELSSPTQGGAAGAQVEVKARARGEALLAGEAE